MPSAKCPTCEGRVFVDANTEMGETVFCEECDSDLELVGLDPIELDPVAGGGEVDDDDFDLFDDGDDDDD